MSAPIASTRCRDCGADNPPGRAQCWLCNAPLPKPEAADGESPFAQPGAAPPDFVPSEGQGGVSFGLDSLLLIVTLTAVVLGVLVQAPALGVLFAFVAVPALVRTMVVQGRLKQEGQPMNAGQKVIAFLGSFGVALLATAAALIVFVGTCFPTGLIAFDARSEALFVVAWGGGILAGAAVFYFILRAFWRRRAK